MLEGADGVEVVAEGEGVEEGEFGGDVYVLGDMVGGGYGGLDVDGRDPEED